MKNSKLMLCVLGSVLAFTVAAATAADAPKLTFKFSKTKVPGALQTLPSGISNSGVTVGQYEDSSGVSHGYILKGKNLTTLDDPNGEAGTTYANQITLNGTVAVVGAYLSPADSSVGFVYKGGQYTDVPGPAGAVASVANGVNDYEAIVGAYTDSRGKTHGFLLTGNGYTTLDVPGSSATYAAGVNDKEDIVLYWLDSAGAFESSLHHGKGKTYKTINVPRATNSFASNISNKGDVSYEWLDSSGAAHGALLHAGKYYKFDYPKAVLTYGGGINDKSTIVGGYETKSKGPYSGFEASYK